MMRRLPWFRLLSGVMILLIMGTFAGAAVAERSMPSALAASACLVAAGICIGSTLVKPAAKPFLGFIDRIYFGNNTVEDVPLLNLRLARAYRCERCFQKCVDECERQLEHHPLAPDLWAELLLAHRGAGNREAEAETLDRALICLGMTHVPARFAKVVRERDNLPHIAAGLMSQFER